ncbi:hypothetical protein M0805_003083 [Coniferiporia weirii]|nr:hypothetical protein M0805_003083 [Coniferiporia weirii]
MSSDNQVALSRMTRAMPGALSKATRQAVPPFLQKLYEMVSDSATDSLIRWSDSGDSFFVLDHERVAHDVLPRWFKHSNFASFVRQLNMYGFHKIPHLQQGVLKSETETEIWNFEHQNFHRGQPDLLCLITRKKQAPERQAEETPSGDKDSAGGFAPAGLSAGSLVDINSIINGISAIKRHQATISADLNDLKSSNQHLWQEALDARERHKKQQDTINRILKFLAGVFGNSATPRKGSPSDGSPPAIPRKRQRLMIEGAQQSLKQGALEPLDDDEDLSVEAPDDRKVSTDRIVEVSPSPVTHKNHGFPIVSEAQVSPTSLPTQPSDLADVVMNGNFATQSPFVPFASAASSSDPAVFNSSFPHAEEKGTANALTSTSQGGANQDVLQAIANSPGQLQRLLQLLNFQQQNVPMPPPLDLNADVNHATEDFAESHPLSHQQAHTTPLTVSDKFSLIEPDQQTLSLLQADELSPLSFEPLLTTENQLQKTHRDAAAISEDIDAIQTSLDSLINNLGFDPSQITRVHDSELHTRPDAQPGMQTDSSSLYASAPTEDNTDPLQHPPTFTPSVPSSFTPESLTSLNSDGTLNTDDVQFQSTIPEFDFNAFINELTRQQNGGDVGVAGFGDFGTDGLDPFMKAGTDVSTSPHLSAFVDEVASQSDASSPSVTRATIVDDPALPSILDTPEDPSKKARKRKSDTGQVVGERLQVKAKRKR